MLAVKIVAAAADGDLSERVLSMKDRVAAETAARDHGKELWRKLLVSTADS
jgi:hypothetical protein